MQAGQAFLPGRMPTERVDEISYGDTRKRISDNFDRTLPDDSWKTYELLGGQNTPALRNSIARLGSRMQSQRELLRESGVPEATAAVMGALHDTAFDPFSSVGSSVKAARAGQQAQAIRNLAEEVYLYGGFLADEGVQSLGDLRFDDMPRYYAPK
jgi:hypothetical protein